MRFEIKCRLCGVVDAGEACRWRYSALEAARKHEKSHAEGCIVTVKDLRARIGHPDLYLADGQIVTKKGPNGRVLTRQGAVWA